MTLRGNILNSGIFRSAIFAGAGGAPVIPWYLSGGIAAANCIVAYQPKGAASYAASRVNIANPGAANAAEGVAPGWDAVNGWSFDGINDYLYAPVTIGNGWTAAIRAVIDYTWVAANRAPFGVVSSGFEQMHPRYDDWAGGFWFFYYGTGGAGAVTSVADSVIIIAGTSAYYNGVLKTAALSGTLAGVAPARFGIGCRTWAETEDNFMRQIVPAFALYNTQLTAPQAVALSIAMAAL